MRGGQAVYHCSEHHQHVMSNASGSQGRIQAQGIGHMGGISPEYSIYTVTINIKQPSSLHLLYLHAHTDSSESHTSNESRASVDPISYCIVLFRFTILEPFSAPSADCIAPGLLELPVSFNSMVASRGVISFRYLPGSPGSLG